MSITVKAADAAHFLVDERELAGVVHAADATANAHGQPGDGLQFVLARGAAQHGFTRFHLRGQAGEQQQAAGAAQRAGVKHGRGFFDMVAQAGQQLGGVLHRLGGFGVHGLA